MTRSAALMDDFGDDKVWWYRDGAATCGPVTMAELQRLAQGPLGPKTLVWRKTFGESWKQLGAALAGSPDAESPPVNDYGRWTESFAKFQAHPEKSQWSWLGLLGPLAYFYLGMWQRALVILSVGLMFNFLFAIAEYGIESKPHVLHALLIASFCVRNIKRDYYKSRVLGETMWSRLRFMRHGYACGGVAAALFLALIAVKVTDPFDNLVADVAGVWQGEDGNVAIDIAGDTKTITYGGETHAVRPASVDGVNEVIVFKDLRHPNTVITLSKHWTEAHDKYSVALLVNDQLVADLVYLRPV